ncbi:MAG: MMPL family transporter [Chloroflexi bacterium]|nr:MMPL family transporter [Chloroflexota bacterium]
MRLHLSTEALARASARRPWTVIGVWAAVLAVSLGLIASLLGSALTTEEGFTSNPESKRAEKLLGDQLRGPEHANEIVIVRSTATTVDDPQFRSFVQGLFTDISALGPGIIAGGTNYYASGDSSLVSSDRHTTILPFTMAGTTETADDNIDQVLQVVDKANGAGGFQVLISGGASIHKDFQAVAESDLQTGETVGVPIALVVLLVVFGAVTAAAIPLVLGIFAIVVALGITALLGQGFQFSFFVTNVITMMGLAVGIDYSLFIVSRYREERLRGRDKEDAIAAAGATASRAMFFSGMTVVLALFGLLLVPSTIFKSLGAGAIIVVVVSVLVSLTLLPAILGLLGDRVNTLRLPFIGRQSVAQDHEAPGGPSAALRTGFWDRLTRAVMRYPWVALVAAAALLIALAVPYLDMKTGAAGVSTLPDGLQTKDGFQILTDEFNFGRVLPTEIAIEGDIRSPEVQEAIRRLETTMASDSSFGAPTLQVNQSGDVALLSVPVNGDFAADETIATVRRLRSNYVPQAFAGVKAQALVGGGTAMDIDYFDQTDRYTPIVFAFVLGLSFILLTVVFRSLVVPVKAIIMNLLSVGASYGLLVLVFQKGVGNELLGFQKVDIIEAWVPLFTFSILFGLSMDYHVFLLSRIRERFHHTGDNGESVAFGVRSTAGIITGAALIMASVFGGVAMGDLVMFQQMGFGLGVAVLLDATIVRSILVPAAMELLGDRNWYLPRVLQWLPQVQAERSETTAGPVQTGSR